MFTVATAVYMGTAVATGGNRYLVITFMSPSSTHFGDFSFARMLKHCSIASCVLLPILKPYDFASATVSAISSSEKLCNVCIARSNIVGIPNGLSFCSSWVCIFSEVAGVDSPCGAFWRWRRILLCLVFFRVRCLCQVSFCRCFPSPVLPPKLSRKTSA